MFECVFVSQYSLNPKNSEMWREEAEGEEHKQRWVSARNGSCSSSAHHTHTPRVREVGRERKRRGVVTEDKSEEWIVNSKAEKGSR